MLLQIKVITRASKNEIIPIGDNTCKIKLTTVPADNKANEMLIKLLADEFDVSKAKSKSQKGDAQKIN